MVRFISDFFLNILYMPKNNINYSNTIIYKIVCNDLNIKELYIGSTTDFYNRKSNHKSKCNSENDKNYNSNIYKCIRANGGWDNWSMIEIEKFPCKDSLEARARERYWCEQLNATLNSNKPYITDNEIKEYNKEYIRNYYQNNKEYLTEYNNKYYQNNKDKLLEYKLNNKDKILNYQAEYRINNKYKLYQKQDCICGSKFIYCNKNNHLKSNKHHDFINKMETSSSTTTKTSTLE